MFVNLSDKIRCVLVSLIGLPELWLRVGDCGAKQSGRYRRRKQLETRSIFVMH
jgi:hypothetical protein